MSSSTLGIAFVVLGFSALFLMMHLWGYPYDKVTRTSAAPRWAMYAHRVIGFAYALVYVLLMAKMLPRLWEYQVEFPARTVVHIVVGFTIGFLLILKIAIIRFFRHFEEWMPYLGTAIVLGTVIMLGLSLPFAWREEQLHRNAAGGSAFSKASQERVARLLPAAGLPAEARVGELASEQGLRSGRNVLTMTCVKCHDLKTILDQPRTPAGWLSVVERMAEKPTLFGEITPEQQWRVTAYLVAITPDLQKSRKQRREEDLVRAESMKQAAAAMQPAMMGGLAATIGAIDPTAAAPPPKPAIDPALAKATYEDRCSQCHDLSDVDADPPTDEVGASVLINRMITENEAELSKADIELIQFYLVGHFVQKTL